MDHFWTLLDPLIVGLKTQKVVSGPILHYSSPTMPKKVNITHKNAHFELLYPSPVNVNHSAVQAKLLDTFWTGGTTHSDGWTDALVEIVI